MQLFALVRPHPVDLLLVKAVVHSGLLGSAEKRRRDVGAIQHFKFSSFVQLSGGLGPDGVAIDNAGNLVIAHVGLGSVCFRGWASRCFGLVRAWAWNYQCRIWGT